MSQLSQKSFTWQQISLILVAVIFFAIIILMPLLTIFYAALDEGWQQFWLALNNEESLAAIYLTLKVAFITLPINLVLGIIIAWTIAYFNFKGKSVLTAILDLPFSISPVVVGLMFLLLFGLDGLFGAWLQDQNIRVIFALPGIVLATLFVTFPLIAKSLIPSMTAQGSSEEQAGLILGASPWQLFYKITLPKIKWPLIYGVILSNARAMGEFGAVSVVSGHIRGLTNTIPLYVEITYNEYQFIAAFACASLLALLAILTLVVQQVVMFIQQRKLAKVSRQ
ncbi:sulfate transport system permease protein [Volucribacter psittacicida]|uniref:Sulfate transport system permease protein n=1 Tax=Volucribacter psittacicida TaxID=203482 RepID=A0A4R1FLE4_9PAST|nr:sulfate ABC transporter permease subunit CysW [Volucribacter psittacicida]TCJ95826.1 sulfate transport system permease protein [Volucribacter psittacicida]